MILRVSTRRFVAALTVAFLLTVSLSASAQTTQAEPKSDPGGDERGNHRTLIATVFGKDLYLEDIVPADAKVKDKELPPGEFDNWLRGYPAARTYDHIWAAVSKRYVEREKIGVSEAEMSDLKKSVEKNLKSRSGGPDDSPFPSMEQKGISVAWAHASLMDWKLSKSLYEKFGGRVGIGSLGAWIALDGQHAVLKEHHNAGDIKFHHPELEEAFWQYAQRARFADAYPKGEELTRLFATPPYLRADATAKVEQSKRERIGSSLGKDIYRDELKFNPPTYDQVARLFMGPAIEEYEREVLAKVEMTDAEIRAGVEWMEADAKKQGGARWEQWQAQSKQLKASVDQRLAEIKRQLDDPATSENGRPMLKSALRVTALEATHPHAGEVWFVNYRRKLEQYLFDNYGGGRIIHQQFGPEALDARKKLLQEMEKEGKFEVTDPELRKLAYNYWERPNHPGGFHTDRRILMFPWTKEHQEMVQEQETVKRVEPASRTTP